MGGRACPGVTARFSRGGTSKARVVVVGNAIRLVASTKCKAERVDNNTTSKNELAHTSLYLASITRVVSFDK